MGDTTSIAWTDATANYWLGCTKVSDGCKHCYAERFAKNRMGLDVWGASARQPVKKVWATVARLGAEVRQGRIGVMGANKPLLVFVGSMMDWAEDRAELKPVRAKMWEQIRAEPALTFQLLTKRPDRIEALLPATWGQGWPNVWLGTSIEDMRVAERAEQLRRIPAVVHFVSYEPALGPLDDLPLDGIDWVIYGGESGPEFRSDNADWARAMKRRCEERGVAFFHKQSAANLPGRGVELDGATLKAWPRVRGRH